MNNPYDRFIASNIDAFLERPPDEILIGVDNEELMKKHLPYVVHELGGAPSPELKPHLGEPFYEYTCKSINGCRPVQHRKPPYLKMNLRGGGGVQYKLMYRGQELGTISDAHWFREAYIGAIYHHFGKAYRVLNHGAEEIELEEAEPHLRTEGRFDTVMQDGEILQAVRYAENLAAYYGRVTVFENFAGYKVIDTRTGEVIDEQFGQAARLCAVRAFWLEVADRSPFAYELGMTGLWGVEQLLRIGAPFVIPCDRHDLGTWTKTTRLPAIYLYETVAGGIGVAEKALQTWPTILQMGINIAQRCPCQHGCPRCLEPPHGPADAAGPNKQRAIQLALTLIELADSAPRERYEPDTHCWAPWPGV